MVGKYDVNEAIEVLFDDKFGLSDSDLSEEESKDTYYRREACLTKELVEDL